MKILKPLKLNTKDLLLQVAPLNLKELKIHSMMSKFLLKLTTSNRICLNYVPTDSTNGTNVISSTIRKQLNLPLNNKNTLAKNYTGKLSTLVQII